MQADSPSNRMAGKMTRRQLLRSGLALTAGLSAAYLLGCGDESAPPQGQTNNASPTPQRASPTASPAALNPRWQRLQPAGQLPPARRDHSLTSDREGSRVYLFGGRNNSGQLADLWVYDVNANTWTRISASGAAPEARFGHNAVFDPTRGRLIVFGGQAGSSFFNDIWAFDLSRNSWSRLAGGGPEPRYGAGGAYDPQTNRFYISHGFTDQGRFDDSWAFSLEADRWSDESSPTQRPLKRCLLRMAVDSERRRILLFGGQSNPEPFLGDLWAYDINSRGWRQLSASGPAPRNLYSLVGTEGGQLLLFGGRTREGDDSQLWLFDLARDAWTLARPQEGSPAARNSHDAAWLPARRSMLLFGGQTADGDVNDLWQLTLA